MPDRTRLLDMQLAEPAHVGRVACPAFDLHPGDDFLVLEGGFEFDQAAVTLLIQVIVDKFHITNLTNRRPHSIWF